MAGPFYMQDGKLPTRGGVPTLITQAEFEACCCNTYCRVALEYECIKTEGGTSVNPRFHTSGQGSWSSSAAVSGAGKVYAVRTSGVWNTDPDDPAENCWKIDLKVRYNGTSQSSLFYQGCVANKFTQDALNRGILLAGNSFYSTGAQGVSFRVTSNTPDNNITHPGSTILVTLYRVTATHTWVGYFPKTDQSCVDAHSGTLPGALPACTGSEFIRRLTPVGQGITEVSAVGGDAGWS